MTKTSFTEKPNDYSYFPLSNGKADVFVRVFDHEETDEEGNVSYIYHTNEFRADRKLITEEMVAADPGKYLEYVVPGPVTEEERLDALESAFLELMGV